MDFFSPGLSKQDINDINILALAHLGDAVYEVMVRTLVCSKSHEQVRNVHLKTVSMANAPFQAKAAERIAPLLTDEELDILRRGRNAKVNTAPKHCDIAEYHAATGLEALFGYLYLLSEKDRLIELFRIVAGED